MRGTRLLDKMVVALERELLSTLRMRFGFLFEVLLMIAEVAGMEEALESFKIEINCST